MERWESPADPAQITRVGSEGPAEQRDARARPRGAPQATERHVALDARGMDEELTLQAGRAPSGPAELREDRGWHRRSNGIREIAHRGRERRGEARRRRRGEKPRPVEVRAPEHDLVGVRDPAGGAPARARDRVAADVEQQIVGGRDAHDHAEHAHALGARREFLDGRSRQGRRDGARVQRDG